MVMLWFWVCADAGPECTLHGPNPDSQFIPEYIGIDDTPIYPSDLVGDVERFGRDRGQSIRSHSMVLANIEFEDWLIYEMMTRFDEIQNALSMMPEIEHIKDMLEK